MDRIPSWVRMFVVAGGAGGGALAGLLLMGLGLAFFALRETALNTRACARASGVAPTELATTRYIALGFIAVLLLVAGLLTIAGATGAFFVAMQHLARD